MNKRTLSVSLLTAGLSVGVVAGTVGPAAAQGNPVGGSGSYFFLSGAGSTGGAAQKVINFGNAADETFFGDWDGNGTDTPMVRRGGTFFVSDDNGNLQSVFGYGNPGDQVYIGDWNGDGTDSIAVRRGNQYLVKNDNRTTGKADTEFAFGDASDTNVLVGDWDAKNGDSLMIQRANRFFVANANTTGIADFEFSYGDAGNTVLVGDWADPANKVSGNGADQIAVRQGANTYVLSTELGDGTNVKELRRYDYGDAGDQVFVAALATAMVDANGNPVINTKRNVTYTEDVPAVHKAGDPILVWDSNPGDGFVQAKDSVTQKPLTFKGGEAVTQMPGTPQVYRGGEGVVTADGKPVKYVASGATGDNEVNLPASGKVAKYISGDAVLNADGTFVYIEISAGVWKMQTWGATTSVTAATKALPVGADNELVVKAGDQVVRRAGEQAVLVKGSPAVYGTSPSPNGKMAGDSVVVEGAGDLVLNPDGSVARNANGSFKTYAADKPSTTATYQTGAPVLHRQGELVNAYKWIPASFTGATKTATVDTTGTGNTVSITGLVAADEGSKISGAGIPTAGDVTITSVSGTTATLSANLDGTGTAATTVTITAVVAGAFDATTASNPIMDDEDASLYTSNVLVNGAPDPAKSVTKLDADNDSEPVFYNGTEQYVTIAEGDLPNYTGGETALANRKGDVKFNADGTVMTTGDDKPIVITGDGLGVRRSF